MKRNGDGGVAGGRQEIRLHILRLEMHPGWNEGQREGREKESKPRHGANTRSPVGKGGGVQSTEEEQMALVVAMVVRRKYVLPGVASSPESGGRSLSGLP